jgi:hypothetical protein
MSFDDCTSVHRCQHGSAIPDIAQYEPHGSTSPARLDKVGMTQIEVPVRLRDDDDGMLFLAPAKAEAYVSLDDPRARGIHMSRLFLSLQSLLSTEELNLPLIKRLLSAFVNSHTGLSRSSFVRLEFDLLVKRAALVSDNFSWRSYPVSIAGEMRADRFRFRLGVTGRLFQHLPVLSGPGTPAHPGEVPLGFRRPAGGRAPRRSRHGWARRPRSSPRRTASAATPTSMSRWAIRTRLRPSSSLSIWSRTP